MASWKEPNGTVDLSYDMPYSVAMSKIKLATLICKRCFHIWTPRQAEVRACPKCQSPWWDTPKDGDDAKP